MKKINQDNKSWSYKLKTVARLIKSALQLARSHNPRRHSPERRIRKRLTAGIALGVIIIAVGIITYQLADKRINGHLTRALHKITGGEVDIGQAEINILSDIRIRNLNVYLPGMPHEPQYLIFSSDDILLEFNPLSIFTRELEVDRIVAIGALLNLSYDNDEKNWNITKLKLKKGEGKRKSFPKVFIRESYIQYRESSKDYLSSPLKQEFSGSALRNPESSIISFKFVSSETTSLPNCVINGSYNPETLELASKLKFDIEQFASENLPPNLARFRLLYDAINPRGEIVLNSLYSPVQGNRLTVTLEQASAGIDWIGAGAVLPLNNVSGEIVVTSNETIINSVKVGYNDANFLLTGSVKGYSSDSDINLRIISTDMNLPADQWQDFDIMQSNLLDIDRLKEYSSDAVNTGSFKSVLKMLVCAIPEKKKQIISDLVPTGRIDIDASFERSGDVNNVSCDIELVNASGRHVRFPYLLHGAHGPIHISKGLVEFGPIYCSQDGQDITVNGGAAKNNDNKWVIDVDVDAKNIVVNDTLYNAFNNIQKNIFDLFNPTGSADAHYRLNVIQGQPPNDSLELNLKDCSGTFKFFPVPAGKCFGKVRWEREKTTFEVQSADFAGGKFKVQGFIDTPDLGDSVLDCRVDFDNTVLDSTVAGQLPTMIKKLYDKANPLGNLSGSAGVRKVFNGHISKTPIDEIKVDTIEHDINLYLSDASVFLEQFPRKIEKVETNVNIKDFRLNILDFAGNVIWPDNTSPVKASGYIDKNNYTLELDGRRLPFDYDLKDLVSKNIPEIIQKYNPSGIFDLKLKVAREADKKLDYSAVFNPHDMQAVFMDYRVDSLNGEFNMVPGLVTLNNVSFANNSVCLNGSLADKDNHKNIDLKVVAREFPIDDNLKKAFVELVPLLSDEIGLAGDLSCDADLSLDTADTNNDMKWHVKGTGSIADGKLLLPLETTDISSSFQYSFVYDQVNDNLELDADIYDTAALILKRPLKETRSKVSFNSSRHLLDIDIINSIFCNGKLGGRIKAKTDRSDKSTELELIFRNCDLRDVVLAEEAEEIKGRLNGYMNLFYSRENKIGKFEFYISNGALGKLPLIAGILNIINFSMPHQGAFQDASIIGDIVDDKTMFTKMDFLGGAVSINGKGQMVGPFAGDEDKSGELDIKFLIEAPKILKPIPVVESLFNAVRSGFIHVRATGKYDKPVITPIPLSLIGDIFTDYKE